MWPAAAFALRGPLSSRSGDHAAAKPQTFAAQGVTGKSCRLLPHGEKLWPPPDRSTGPFCNGHTWVASFNSSVSVLRVTDDLNHPFDLRQVQSRLSQAAGRGARWADMVPRAWPAFAVGPRHAAHVTWHPQSTAGAARPEASRPGTAVLAAGATPVPAHSGAGRGPAHCAASAGRWRVWPALRRCHLPSVRKQNKGHCAMSGDICGHQDWGAPGTKGAGPRMLLYPPTVPRTAPHRECDPPSVQCSFKIRYVYLSLFKLV